MSTVQHPSIGTGRSPSTPAVHSTPSTRTASLTAGVALALMAVLSGFGIFGAIQPLITHEDAATTVRAILDAELLFRAGIASLILVAILDLIVSSALFTLFEPVNRGVSMTAAFFRVAYTAVFLVAILQLSIALTLLDAPDQALRSIEAFYTIWYTGLILFGIHLLLVAWLGYRSGFMAKVFPVLLAVAGLGYLADGFGVVLIPDFATVVGQFTFVGEVAFIFWLLIRGRRLGTAATGSW